MSGMPQTVALVRWPVEWEALEDMQTFASRFAARRFASDLGDRARIASHELLENAVRYATAGSEVEYEVRDVGSGFEIRVTNAAVESRVALLRKRVADLADGDTGDSYRRALRRVFDQTSEQSNSGGSGGLGLLRVRHEAAVDISIEVESKRVTVVALGRSGYGQGAVGTVRIDEARRALAAKKEANGKVR